jgi:hypothetical protein
MNLYTMVCNGIWHWYAMVPCIQWYAMVWKWYALVCNGIDNGMHWYAMVYYWPCVVL